MSTQKQGITNSDDPTRIQPADYIAERVQDQIDYFNKKSSEAQYKYKFYKRIEFILAASIPVTITFSSMEIANRLGFRILCDKDGLNCVLVNLQLFLQILAAIAGVVMAIISKLVDLEDFHKRWTDFRVNSEALQNQLYLYKTRANHYSEEEDAFPRFVDQIESILNNDVLKWKQKTKQTEEESSKQGAKKPQ